MRFSIFSTALMALGATATTVLTADDLVTSISTLTAKSQALLEPAGTLSLANAALLLVGLGPWAEVLTGLEDMADTAKKQIVEIQTLDKSPTKLAGGEAQLVTDALKGLLSVLSELLKTITGKAGLVTSLPIVGQILAPVLALLDNLLTTLLNTPSSTSLTMFSARRSSLTSQMWITCSPWLLSGFRASSGWYFRCLADGLHGYVCRVPYEGVALGCAALG